MNEFKKQPGAEMTDEEFERLLLRQTPAHPAGDFDITHLIGRETGARIHALDGLTPDGLTPDDVWRDGKLQSPEALEKYYDEAFDSLFLPRPVIKGESVEDELEYLRELHAFMGEKVVRQVNKEQGLPEYYLRGQPVTVLDGYPVSKPWAAIILAASMSAVRLMEMTSPQATCLEKDTEPLHAIVEGLRTIGGFTAANVISGGNLRKKMRAQIGKYKGKSIVREFDTWEKMNALSAVLAKSVTDEPPLSEEEEKQRCGILSVLVMQWSIFPGLPLKTMIPRLEKNLIEKMGLAAGKSGDLRDLPPEKSEKTGRS